MRPPRLLPALVVALLTTSSIASAAGPTLTVVPVDTEPRDGRPKPTAAELAAMVRDVDEHPADRPRRVALVRAFVAARDLDGALTHARAWRARDAYDLVAVRALGDVHMERGEKDEAERVYSAIVELLPGDADAQRALATLLKQRGDVAAARTRLEAALRSRTDDPRLLFELADVELRMGRTEEALARLTRVVETDSTPTAIRHPARQRLGQILAERRRAAKAAGDTAAATALTAKLDALGVSGGLENDIRVYLTWDTDRTDVDLWVTTPSGEKVFYEHKAGAGGESLFDDVTNGYGPETFAARSAAPGAYTVQVNYYGARSGAFPEARGEVVIVTDEGRASERKVSLPYRLFAEKQTVTVATVRVGGGA